MEIPKPIGPYLILEILSRERNQSRGIHVLNMGVKNLIRLVLFKKNIKKKNFCNREEVMIVKLGYQIFQFQDVMQLLNTKKICFS